MVDLLRNFASKWSNLRHEISMGITTRGRTGTSDTETIYYATIHYATIHAVLQHLALDADDVLVDLGCGKGRVVCCAALHEIREVIGIERSPVLARIARRNASRLRSCRTPVTILDMDAREHDYANGTVFYMFHPFGPKTLTDVVEKLRHSLERNPRGVRIVYVNPVHEHVLRQSDFLAEYDRWEPGDRPGVMMTVSFLRSTRGFDEENERGARAARA